MIVIITHRIKDIQGHRDGTLMKLSARFASRTDAELSYGRSMSPAEYGEWIHEFLLTIEPGPDLRLMMDDNMIIAIGHATDERWFDPRGPNEISSTQRQEKLVESAVKFINAHRRGYGHVKIDTSGWLDDDVFTHARELGWSEKT